MDFTIFLESPIMTEIIQNQAKMLMACKILRICNFVQKTGKVKEFMSKKTAKPACNYEVVMAM